MKLVTIELTKEKLELIIEALVESAHTRDNCVGDGAGDEMINLSKDLKELRMEFEQA